MRASSAKELSLAKETGIIVMIVDIKKMTFMYFFDLVGQRVQKLSLKDLQTNQFYLNLFARTLTIAPLLFIVST